MTLSQLLLNLLGFIFLIIFLVVVVGLTIFEKITKIFKKNKN